MGVVGVGVVVGIYICVRAEMWGMDKEMALTYIPLREINAKNKRPFKEL